MDYKFFRTKQKGLVFVIGEFPVERLNLIQVIEESNVHYQSMAFVDYYVTTTSKKCVPMLQPISKKEQKMHPETFMLKHRAVFEKTKKYCTEYKNYIEHITHPQHDENTTDTDNSENRIELSDQYNEKLTKLTIEPLSLETAGKQLPSSKEIDYIRQYINTYLTRLEMKKLHTNIDTNMLMTIGITGDTLINMAILDATANHAYVNILRSNVNMKLAMIKLGFIEFQHVHEHLAGTFFETLYYCAHVQNSPAKERLLRALVSDLNVVNNVDNLFVTEE